jgi:hypothetical protein
LKKGKEGERGKEQEGKRDYRSFTPARWCMGSSVFMYLFADSVVFSSSKLFFYRPLSGVCLSVNFYIFEFFSRTTGPILTRLGTNDPWGEGIQVCSNKGDSLSPRGDNIAKE